MVPTLKPSSASDPVEIVDRSGFLALERDMKTRGFVCGMPARLGTSIGNSHSCRFDMVAEDRSSAGKTFFSHRAADPPDEFPEVSRLGTSMMEIPCHQDLDLATMAKIAACVRDVLVPAGS